MAPLACLPLPLCPLFTAAGVLGVILYAAGVGGADAKPDGPAAERPPYWVALAVLAATTVFLLLLSLVTEV